jgi:predicted ArsR family transcriptional regulator
MKASDLIKLPPIDQKAQTVQEFAGELGISAPTAARYLRDLMAEKRIEMVRKKVGCKHVPAYRTRFKP